MEKTSKNNETAQLGIGAVMHWVSVSERLPEHRQKVLFSTHNRDVHKAIYMDKLINQHGDFEKVFISTDGGHYQLEMAIIQYWMPLPEPPCA
jgi:hypothetical protein